MKKHFHEYHNFTGTEFKQLWNKCLFVFDTNTLLNMYRYSRETVDDYIEVLKELRINKQLWIPYQVGYEFYENRLNVIFEYEKSYDAILDIIEHAKKDIQSKYKEHPFLDLHAINEDIAQGLAKVETQIKQKKETHPKWSEADEVLEKLNELFADCIGENYSKERLLEIASEGKERYEKKIPPGFKDDQKPDNKKYGDLIMWYQTIDKAKECGKPIILISTDIKEDWWLEKDGKRIMPLPQLKKEMHDKAKVGFHIYTADRFLEYSTSSIKNKRVTTNTIKEVRKVREIDEERMKAHYGVAVRDRNYTIRTIDRCFAECVRASQELLHFFRDIDAPSEAIDDFRFVFRDIHDLRGRYIHGEYDEILIRMFVDRLRDGMLILDRLLHVELLSPESRAESKHLHEQIEKASMVYRRCLHRSSLCRI